jgi:iron complex outermembrane recepter protein
LLLMALLLSASAKANPIAEELSLDSVTAEQLASLDIEALMRVQVTSVARRPQALDQSAAAVQVLTAEDIRRSGVLTLPELFRLVPGLSVAQANSQSWAISARGFSTVFVNKMLVLIDGRSIYTPLNGGVFWDGQDTLLEDIERIEVIRGPGASLWGANAVNGVINIITKSAHATHGLSVSAGVGNEERAHAGARYGGSLGPHASYRAFAKYFLRDATARADGTSADDDYYMIRGGFRLDARLSQAGVMVVQGEMFSNRWGEVVKVATLDPPHERTLATRQGAAGGHLRARWSHRISSRADWEVQAYYDQMNRHIPEVVGDQRLHLTGIDIQQRFSWGERQDLVWGAGYRFYRDDTGGLFVLSFAPVRRSMHLFSAFVQDEIAAVEDRARLTAGVKLEHHETVGFEIEPSVRALVIPHEAHTIWAALSRAVRTRTRAEEDTVFHAVDLGPPPVIVQLRGSRQLRSQALWSAEVGYRARLAKELHLDLAMYYNRYLNLTTLEPPTVDATATPLRAQSRFSDRGRSRSYGGELAVLSAPLAGWRLQAAYTLFKYAVDPLAPGITQVAYDEMSGTSPSHHVLLRSLLDLPYHLELDGAVRLISRVAGTNQPIEAYWEADLRLGWRSRGFEVALVGRNLAHPRHREFGSFAFPPIGTAIERSVYLLLAVR